MVVVSRIRTRIEEEEESKEVERVVIELIIPRLRHIGYAAFVISVVELQAEHTVH